jgi:hypothetical protein
MIARSARIRQSGKLAVLALVIAAAVIVALRLSGTDGPSSSAAATSATCLKVSAALSDGPDPSADPVGYAQAQILPLREITTANAPLQHAITGLSNAYKTFYDDGGGASAASLVRHSSHVIDDYCPGATS